jgi:uncharacterized protein YciI
MKYLPIIILLLLTNIALAQTDLPVFLQGTWKMQNSEIYERWDKLGDHSLKGFSYKVEDGQMIVTEYLDITQSSNKTVYTAAVLNQNQGKGIEFVLTSADSAYTFENPDHDFPRKIVYQELSDTEIFVQVSDGGQRGFAYKMDKQHSELVTSDSSVSNPNYDMALAEKLGGDDYGMKSYILVILKTGPNTTTDRELISASFRGHLDNINRLVEQGKLIIAGPLGSNDHMFRGIFILNNVESIEEATELMQTDLAIKNGLLDVEFINWYGSAALPEYLPASDKIWKLKP